MNYSGSDPYKLEELKPVKQILMNDHHTKTIQDLELSIQEAQRIKRRRIKVLAELVYETEKAKALVKKINDNYKL